MEQLRELVKQGKAPETEARVKELLDKGEDPEVILKQALIAAMDDVGELFQKGEYFVPEMLVAARAMQRGMDVIKPLVVEKGIKPLGKVVIGTAKGDLHDIGKNLVAMSLEGAGVEVVDLGIDVGPDKFVKAVKEHKPDVVGMSALLTTTMLSMKDIIQALKDEGLRDSVKVMIGGAPIRQEYADEIGADYYGRDSTEAKNIVRNIVTKEG
jgi:5-methyltetrahydrofolate--homocysteine methyltransferase